MPSKKISTGSRTEVYFLTFTTFRWYYLFDRYQRWNTLADSLTYWRKYRQLKIYEFVFMLNHIHVIIQSPNAIQFVRDFKKFTSKEIKQCLIQNEPNLLRLFKNKSGKYQLWQRTNMPRTLDSDWFYEQKKEYIHYNPVMKDYVLNPEDWYWSSANAFCTLQQDPFD